MKHDSVAHLIGNNPIVKPVAPKIAPISHINVQVDDHIVHYSTDGIITGEAVSSVIAHCRKVEYEASVVDGTSLNVPEAWDDIENIEIGEPSEE